MSLILNIETSSSVCSVCISKDGDMLGIKEDVSENNHASILIILIQQLFKELEIKIESLDAVAVSAGPGSYTGLRIGVVTAKGLCYTLSKPLIALDSLEILKEGMREKYPEMENNYFPTIDARRDEIYFALFTHDATILASQNILLTNELPFKYNLNNKIIVAGSGAVKCKASWKSSDSVIFENNLQTSSKYMCALSEKKLQNKDFADVVSFEPQYIKPVYIAVLK